MARELLSHAVLALRLPSTHARTIVVYRAADADRETYRRPAAWEIRAFSPPSDHERNERNRTRYLPAQGAELPQKIGDTRLAAGHTLIVADLDGDYRNEIIGS